MKFLYILFYLAQQVKLVKNYNQIRPDRATLFCFPFAGGGASAYNSWVQKMKDKVTVCPIQLPGREERIMEKPYNNMTDMLDELEETIWKCIRGPYAFWGHSMGGKIAYELEKRLEKRGKTAQCFLVSGSRIPSIPERNPIYHLPDDEFKKALGRFEGTPKEILENQELLEKKHLCTVWWNGASGRQMRKVTKSENTPIGGSIFSLPCPCRGRVHGWAHSSAHFCTWTPKRPSPSLCLAF